MTRRAFSLLEVLVAAGILVVVLGPLMYLFTSGSLITSPEHSEAMLAALVAAERLHQDLDMLAIPDGPDQDNLGTRPPPFLIKPDPEGGSEIRFWIPRATAPAGPTPAKRIQLVPVMYGLRPVPGTAASYLIRQEAGQERTVGAVLLRRFWVERVHELRNVVPGGMLDPSAGADSVALLRGDIYRARIEAVAKATGTAAMDRTDAARVPGYTVSFLFTIKEPTLLPRLRDPQSGPVYQLLETVGNL